jgi:hypothetical protein
MEYGAQAFNLMHVPEDTYIEEEEACNSRRDAQYHPDPESLASPAHFFPRPAVS